MQIIDELENIEKEQGIESEGIIVASKLELREFMDHMRTIFFPSIYLGQSSLESHVYAVRDFVRKVADKNAADRFMEKMPEIKRLLLSDVRAIGHNDPAVENLNEIVLCYPSIHVMSYFRTAHALLEAGVRMLPRMLTELAHADTGIDIHPAAQIGESFAIDHGTGVVIGETCIIGKNVMLYQGVTLGAKNFQYSDEGTPINVPRHPIVEDNVTIYSNTSVLGRITIGHDTIIGGNIWLTSDVPPYSKISQSKPVKAK